MNKLRFFQTKETMNNFARELRELHKKYADLHLNIKVKDNSGVTRYTLYEDGMCIRTPTQDEVVEDFIRMYLEGRSETPSFKETGGIKYGCILGKEDKDVYRVQDMTTKAEYLLRTELFPSSGYILFTFKNLYKPILSICRSLIYTMDECNVLYKSDTPIPGNWRPQGDTKDIFNVLSQLKGDTWKYFEWTMVTFREKDKYYSYDSKYKILVGIIE